MIRPKRNSLNTFLIFNELSIKELAEQTGIERTRLGKLAQANNEEELRYSMRVSELEALRHAIEGERPDWINPTIPL